MKGRDKLYQINKKNKVIIVIALILVALVVYYFFINKRDENFVELSSSENINTNSNNIVENQEMFVYISGAVNSPGVIKIENDSRVKDVIEKAGGFKENADLTNVNLAEKVEDEKKIYIPEIGEDDEKNGSNEEKEQTKKLSVNVNTANSSELQKLPGIGPSLADSIVEYRKQNGKFASIEDIKKVSGIGESKYNKIKEYIKVK